MVPKKDFKGNKAMKHSKEFQEWLDKYPFRNGNILTSADAWRAAIEFMEGRRCDQCKHYNFNNISASDYCEFIEVDNLFPNADFCCRFWEEKTNEPKN
jgi:hypothetical protein